MSDFIPKPAAKKVTGLGPKAQKLQAMRDKLEQQKSGAKPGVDPAQASYKAKSLAGTKKTSFQRKAT